MLTLKDVYAALAAQGYTGNDSDANAMALFVTAKNIELTGDDGTPLDVLKLATPAPVKKTALKIAAAPAEAPKAEPAKAPDITEAVQKAVSEIEAKLVKGFDLKRPNFGEVATVKTGLERRYDDMARAGQAIYKDFGDEYCMANWFAHRLAQGQGKFDVAQKHWGAFAEAATRKGFATTTMEAGGATIPEFLESNVQELALTYGVTRKLARVVKMTSDTYKRPRVSGDLRVYYPGEGAAGTDDSANRTWDQIKLTAKKGVVIAKASREINQDSIINIMEDAVRSGMRSIAKLEDETLFNGTGAGAASPATYIPGCRGIVNTFGTTATGDSRSVTGGDSMDATTLTHLVTLMSLPGTFGGNNVFVCSPVALALILFRLGQSQGGVSYAEYQNFGPTPRVLGRPVITTEVMNKTNSLGSDLTDVLYGDISLAATFGERQGIEVDISDQRYWDEDNVGIKLTVRHDLNVHDLGSTTTQSPVAALFQT